MSLVAYSPPFIIRKKAAVQGALPSWVPSTIGQWALIPGTDQNLAVFGAGGTGLNGMIAQSGMAIDPRNGDAYWHGFGHNASPATDNRVVKCDLSGNTAVLSLVRDATPGGCIVLDNTPINAANGCYNDGRPLATHTYVNIWISTKQNRMMRIGLPAGPSTIQSGSYQSNYVAGFRLGNSNPPANMILPATACGGVAGTASYDWDPAMTYPSCEPGVPYHGCPHVHDFANDIHYFVGHGQPNAHWYKWSGDTPTVYTALYQGNGVPNNPNLGQLNAVLDLTRGYIVTWLFTGTPGVRKVTRWNTDGSGFTDITAAVATANAVVPSMLTAMDAICLSDGQQSSIWHITGIDKYLCFNRDWNVTGQSPIMAWDPTTLVLSVWPTTGYIQRSWNLASSDGVYTRMHYSPAHKSMIFAGNVSEQWQVLRVSA